MSGWSFASPPHSWAKQLELESSAGRFFGRKEWIRALAGTGQNLKQCAELAGIARGSLSQYANLYGVKFSSGRKLTKAALAPLVAKSLGVKAIAEELDATPVGVRYALAKDFPEFDPPRLRARPLHRSTKAKRPSRAGRKKTQDTPGAAENLIDQMIAVARQEVAARSAFERGQRSS